MAIEELLGPAPDGWEYLTLGVACERGGGDIQTGPFGSQLHASDYVPFGVPSIMPQNIGDNRIVEDGIARITPEDAKRLTRYLVRTGDIVYSRRGDVERRALVRDNEDGWLCGTGCLRVRFGEDSVDPAYASYYLGHPSVREWIVRHAHGATMPNLNTSILAACPFLVPPRREQTAISHVLGNMDEKIDLNRSMNEALEAIARAIFKSWFVDFDPVRAKADGKDQALPKRLADLFPDAFADSELGPIPRGWDVRPIGEVVQVVGGSTPSTTEAAYWDGPHFFATPKDLSGLRSPLLLKTERTITEKGAEQISSGVLPPGAVLLSSRAPIGYVAIAGVPVSVNQGFIAMLCDRELPSHYVVAWAKLNVETFKQNAGGTTFAEISKRIFRPLPVLVPPKRVLDAFELLVGSLYTRIEDDLREAETLAALRDALLPRLISGELPLKDAEGLAQVAT